MKVLEDTTLIAGLDQLKRERFWERLWARDASLWKADKQNQKSIKNALGWLTAPEATAASLGPVRSFASEILKENFESAVVLGVGGSSLSCDVFRTCLPARKGHPQLQVIDSTHPGRILAAAAKLNLKNTLFFVASKSGSTIEPNSLYAYFAQELAKAGGKASRQLVAITDPGTSLARLAVSAGFRKVFLSQSDVGGRYSALTHFGIAPAAVAGMDVEALLTRVRRFIAAARARPEESRILCLGAFLGAYARAGRNKLTLFLPPGFEWLGLWIEQLVAESIGKEGRTLLPAAESSAAGLSYGRDRIFVALKTRSWGGAELEKHWRDLEEAGHPVMRLELADILDLGSHLFLWEAATAVAGFFMGVNPFDQPDVEAAKVRTRKLLSTLDDGQPESQRPSLRAGGLAAFCDEALARDLKTHPGMQLPLSQVLKEHLGRVKAGDYCVILAYLDENPQNLKSLEAMRGIIRRAKGVPVMLSFGPRYLHSSGQMYKGGGGEGVFLMLVDAEPVALEVPGQAYSFGTLNRAQAWGDFETMLAAGRRILHLELGPPGSEPLKACLNAVEGMSHA